MPLFLPLGSSKLDTDTPLFFPKIQYSPLLTIPLLIVMRVSLTNNRIARMRLALEAFKAGSKVWDWWGRSIEDAWDASPHPRAARTRAKRAF